MTKFVNQITSISPKASARLTRGLVALVSFIMLVMLTTSLTACAGSTADDAVAATVNGENIMESEVTDFIEDMRSYDGTRLSDEEWASALLQANLTPETLRDQTIEYLIDVKIVYQEAERLEIDTDSSAVTAYVEQIKSSYESDDAFLAALQYSGFMNEQRYCDYLMQENLSDAICEQVIGDIEPTEEQLVNYAQENGETYVGRRSSHILLTIEDSTDEDEVAQVSAQAQEILDMCNAEDADFAALAAEYSEDTGSASSGGDVGWDFDSTFVTEYQNALDELSLGEISGLVQSSYGIHIIKCTGVYAIADGETADYASMPTEIQELVKQDCAAELESEAFSEYMLQLRDDASVTINDMPEGLSYDVDMSLALDESDSTSVEEESEGATEADTSSTVESDEASASSDDEASASSDDEASASSDDGASASNSKNE